MFLGGLTPLKFGKLWCIQMRIIQILICVIVIDVLSDSYNSNNVADILNRSYPTVHQL